MSTTAANPKGPRTYAPGQTAQDWATTFLLSTVGRKVLTALTGLGLAGFVVFHMIGNLKVFSGRDSLNAYASFLKHDLGLLIWLARGGLLGLFLLHAALALWLNARTAKARPVPYVVHRTAQATFASRTMLSTGIVIGVFTLFHLAHYTFGWVHGVELVQPDGKVFFTNYLALTDDKGRHDVYSMVVAGFRTPWIAILYLVSQVPIAVHLSHGVKSALQTLGLVGRRFTPVAEGLAVAVAAAVFLGNCGLVLGVWAGFAPPVYPIR